MARGSFKNKEEASDAGKKSKRGAGRFTLLQKALEELGIKEIKTIDQLKQSNLEEFLMLRMNAKGFQQKLALEKELAKYLHAQKKESQIEMKGTINLIVNSKIAGETKTK